MQKYKEKRKLETLTCDFCGREFTKPKSEYLRNVRLGRHNFCSRSCAGKHMHTLGLPQTKKQKKASKDNLKRGNDIDIYTPFRSTLRRVRNRYKEVNINEEDLKAIWEKQGGKCAYTGIDLQLPIGNKKPDYRYQASLDRIDSSKGYVKGNIQFVATPINFMKSTMSDDDFRRYLNNIAVSVLSHNKNS